MKLRNDERGAGGSGFNFLLALFCGGLMGLVLRYMITPVMDMARTQTDSTVALRGIAYTETVIVYFGLGVLITATFYLLTTAIIDRRYGI